MEIEYALIGTGVTFPTPTLPTIYGAGLHEITLTQFPMPVTELTAVVQLRFDYTEIGQSFQVDFSLCDGNGKAIAPRNQGVVIPNMAAADELGHIYVVTAWRVPPSGVTFYEPGHFAFLLVVNGQERARLPLQIKGLRSRRTES